MFTFTLALRLTARIAAVTCCVLAGQATWIVDAPAQSRAKSHTTTRTERTSSPLVRFTDKNGRTHYTSELDSVPAQFRNAAETGLKLPEVTYKDHVIEQPSLQSAPLGDGSKRGNGQGESGKKPPSNSYSASSNDGTLDYIKYWLHFTADTFNKMSSLMSGK